MNIKWSYRFGCFFGHAKSQSKQKWYAFFFQFWAMIIYKIVCWLQSSTNREFSAVQFKEEVSIGWGGRRRQQWFLQTCQWQRRGCQNQRKGSGDVCLELDSYNVSRTENDKCIILYITNGFFDLSFSYSFVEFTL